MQDIHSVSGGRFLDGVGGGGGGGDRRMRQHHHQNQQALKCPRCDSLNTKFCYYNNYNLSQPRHFCKSCRRYWTKGGVLRNVPVGGGCRKSKRSSKPKTSSSSEPPTPELPPPPPQQDHNNSNSHSSSVSSSLTAATAEAVSENIQDESKSLNNQSSKPNLESGVMEQGGECGIFSEIGSFTSLITPTNEAMSFGFGEVASFRFGGTGVGGGLGGNDLLLSGEWEAQQKGMGTSHDMISQPDIQIMAGGSLLDQTVAVDLSALQSKSGNGSACLSSFGSLDWQGSGDQGLFDLPNTVDHAYWSQTTHWSDQDNPSLFHLP